MHRQEGTELIPGHTEVTAPARAPVGRRQVDPDASAVPTPPALGDGNTRSAEAGGHVLSAECSRIGKLLSRIGDKWSVMVVMLLRGGPQRFSELKRGIGGVSQRMLTLTLRGLERDGLVFRKVYPTTPPRVDYELTALGHSLRTPVEALGQWALAHLDEIDRARTAFDDRQAIDLPKTARPSAGR